MASLRRLALVLACLVVGTLLSQRQAQAQEPLPAVLPTVVFLIEDSERMSDDWDGDPSLGTAGTRWSYVKDYVIRVLNSAPVGFSFGVALTRDGLGSDSIGFEPLSYPGVSKASIIAQLNGHTPSTNPDRKLAESYSELLEYWAAQTWSSLPSWQAGPFRYSCSELIVIVIGTDVGSDDSSPNPGYFTTSPVNDFLCNDSTVAAGQACFLDNVSHFAYNSFSAPVAGTGSVKTHTILVDSNSPTISSQGESLFQSAAQLGQGLYYAAPVPGSIGTSIWGILNDSFSGSYSNAAISMSPSGNRLFTSYHEVQGGHPLFKGHLLAYSVDNAPTSATYGQVMTGSGPVGELWDAGQLLASRMANANENNQFESLGTWNTNLQRTGYTARSAMEFNSALLPFDRSSLGAGTDLTTLLVTEGSIPLTSNLECSTLLQDYDFDCDGDWHDAQLLVNFLRGVSTAVFLSTGLPRGPWKMGDTGHSVAVVAPASLDAIATEPHFIKYKEKLASLPSMVYVNSNAGMLHAFVLDVPAHAGGEYWFYIPRAKLHRDPGSDAVREYDGFQADDLMRSGQTSVNDGRVTIEHVWLDGYKTGLTGCGGPSYSSGGKDGIIDPDGCEWHRVVVWSGGYGARHTYALDVTNPYLPRFMWERSDLSSSTGPGKGRAVGSPGVMSFYDVSGSTAQKRWLAVWGGGAQSPGVGVSSAANTYAQAAIYIHDLDSTGSTRVPTAYPQEGFYVPHPALSNRDSDTLKEYLPPEQGLFGTPALADLDGDGSVDVGFIGDSMGYVFKIKFNELSPGSPSVCTFSTPNSNDDAKHVYYPPAPFFSQAGELLVYYASGSPFNIYNTSKGGVYVRKDPTPFGCSASVAAPCASGSALFNSSGFYRFSGIGEKLVGAPTVVFGRMFFATHIPGSDPCLLGNSRLYGLNVETCGGGIFDVTTDSYSVTDNLFTEMDGLISEPVFANGQMYALNVDGGPMNQSDLANIQVTPTSIADFVYSSWRHVY
tara:strand:- start:2825 stop:5818 length:2994 start_codon:yes stop_codon:yes gene_type:complete